MADFDERSGIVSCSTPWGSWWQTVGEVYVEINWPKTIGSKQILCEIKPRHIRCVINGEAIIEGTLAGVVRPDDSTWTLEDRRVVRILLSKARPDASNCWKALLDCTGVGSAYEANPYLFDQMQQKLTLERFQKEQPGFDFSGAEISGNYHDGGPRIPA